MKHIFIILHGYQQTPKKYDQLKIVIKDKYPNATVLVPQLPFSALSTTHPDKIIATILDLIDKEWDKEISRFENNEIPEIIIIGHSIGSVIARKLYLVACGGCELVNTNFNDIHNNTPKVWVKHVSRIVLLAGTNRGWSINSHLYTKTAILAKIGVFVGMILRLAGIELLIFRMKRGSSFMTEFRIQWITMLRNSQLKNTTSVPIIQLLGTKDDIISPEDNIDVFADRDFIYLEVPNSDHTTVLNVVGENYEKKRREVFESAITQSIEALRDSHILALDQTTLIVDPKVTDVVFVIHGIRDTGYWTQKIARRVKAIGDKLEGKKFATETSTYGYFAMLPFLVPFVRRRKVEWLMVQYTENFLLYPNADFSFVGHSNGTYLLAKSLKEYPFCKFKNVVFAGSVVQKGFEWKRLIEEKRVKRVYNLVATSDWVVAIFPKAFQTLKLQDIGSGGFDGFKEELNSDYQLKYVKGGHGSAINEIFWDDISNFIVYGNIPLNSSKLVTNKRTLFMRILGATAPLPFLMILALLVLIFWAIWVNSNGINLVIFISAYLFVIWKIITSY